MARAVRLDELRSRTLRRADMINSSFRTSTTGGEVDQIINAEYFLAYDLLILADGDYFLEYQDFTTVAQQDAYSLPSTFYKIKGVDAFLTSGSSGAGTGLRRFRFDERNRYQNSGAWTVGSPVAYRTRGSSLIVAPKPPAGITCRIWYHAVPTKLTSDSQTIDAVANIDELIVIGSARKLLEEEGDLEAAGILATEYVALKRDVEALVVSRDTGEPEQARDLYAGDE